LRRLVGEFRDELAALGNNVRAIQDRLDRLTRDVADIRAELARMPKIHGSAFVGFRSDQPGGGGNYADYDGRIDPLHNQQAVVHLFDLSVNANVPGGATVTADIQSDNYKNYLDGTFGRIIPTGLAGAPGPFLSSNVPADTRLDRLEIQAPLSIIGRGSTLTIGRVHEQLGHLTLWKPPVDSYFDVPWIDDGAYRMDGAKLTTNFGSLSFEAFGAQLSSVQGTDGMGPINSPLAGNVSNAVSTHIFNANSMPLGQIGMWNGAGTPTGYAQGQNVLQQLVGVNLGVGIPFLSGGHIRFTALDGKTDTSGTAAYDGVWIFGADADFRLMNRVLVTADYGKSIAITGHSNEVYPHEDNAFNADLAYNSGSFTLSAGYRYIDPLFYAPGYWGRIGNWINPTNVMGPNVRASLDVTHQIRITLGGDYYTAARYRELEGGLGKDDEIARGLLGVRFDVTRAWRLTADYEGDWWTLVGPHSGIPGMAGLNRIHPFEDYVTLGTAYHLTSNTMVHLAYQSKFFDGHGVLQEGPAAVLDSAGIWTASANVSF
jgi:hypothetical protein